MRIAVIGGRGLPSKYGGIERHVEEIYRRLAERGHEIVVYSRSNHSEFEGWYEGLRVRRLPVVGGGGWETLSFTFLATLDAMFRGFDIVHYHSLAPSALTPLAHWGGKRVVCTVHSIDWMHSKWGPVARSVLRFGEFAAVRWADRTIAVSDSLALSLSSRHGDLPRLTVIPNGVTNPQPGSNDELRKLDLEASTYVLYVGRLVPEKGPHLVVEAAMRLPHLTFVVAGGSGDSSRYERDLKSSAPANVRFPGFVHGSRLAALYGGALLCVVPSAHEGFGLAAVEAMAYGRSVIASDIPVFREVIGECGRYFPSGDADALAAVIRKLSTSHDELRELGEHGRKVALTRYRWDAISEATEVVLREALARKSL